ncbi:MBL fold metallo-hydrolase [Marivivens sp. LCG002]|uniref:MBL fold metallo-hydrolase n=1 Tax=Marivivens sp. LCG002 TaxID=3051171 RepID=UPI0025558593|nr:MBL fold metallo-hydrolase [Marivivens sp. LCG002]WIV51327.1 MBL fold metallo-hydrolase [Marivivens sp. LCG002]
MKLSRRHLLATGLASPFLATSLFAQRAFAEAHMTPALPTHRSFALGEFKVTTLLAGSTPREDPHSIFGLNVSDEEFSRVSKEAFLPEDMAQFFFTPTLVDTGEERILFDTGLNAGGITHALAAAGYTPSDITHVVLTHMHGDHIGGLMQDGAPTFENAAYVTGQVEYDHWAGAANDGFEGNVRPLADKMTFLSDGGSVRSGITAMLAAGHTPGHMAYMLESGGKQLLLMADTANHYVYSLAHPDWEVRFDMDKAAAAATRRRLFDMASADQIPLIGYHMPFPGLGYVETRGEGYHFVPHSYQLMG